MLLRCAAVFLSLGSGGVAAIQSDWSRFRGPNGTGVADVDGLPVELDRDENLAWRTALPPGHSSPVLSDTLVFLTAFEGDELLTFAIERESGAVAWKRALPRVFDCRIDQRNNRASPTPAVDGDLVVVFFQDFGLAAYDHEGGERWRHALGPFDNVYGMGASPILVGGAVVLACDQNVDSFLLALSKKDGSLLWRKARPWAKSGHCTPVLHEDGERPQLILPGSFYLDGYDLETGERTWWVKGLSFEMKSVPVLHEGVVYINGYGSPLNDPGQQVVMPDFADVIGERDADDDGRVSKDEMPPGKAAAWFEFVDLDRSGALDSGEWTYLQDALASHNGMLAIRAGGAGDRTKEGLVWSYHRSVPQLPSPLIYDGVLYMLGDQGGLVTTFRPASGEVLARGRVKGAEDAFYAAPVAGDGKVYLVGESGRLAVLPAGGSLEPLAVSELGERCYATPALAEGCLYQRTEAALYCFVGDGGRK